jgi:large subunit ribosomal protein L14
MVSAANKVKRGDIRHAIIVRTKKELGRKDGSRVKFDDNACVLINKSGDPIGTRISGMILDAPPLTFPAVWKDGQSNNG